MRTTDSDAAQPARIAGRVDWLDGVRASAAMFVVLHHCWLAIWPAFPRNTGPWWLGGLLYGHLAVAVFIVVSGFSLALAPLRKGGRLAGGIGTFLRRRALRILPPYWTALVFSTALTALVLHPQLSSGVLVRGFVVHGLLLQDAIGSVSPNGAFWSIAVEWQIYFVFPLILWLARRTDLGRATAATIGVVVVAHAIASGPLLGKLNHLTPQFLALFATGILAVRVGQRALSPAGRRGPGTVAAVCAGTFLVLAVTQGSVWVSAHFFWIDLLVGVGVAALLAVMYGGGMCLLRRALSTRGAQGVGRVSYSLYLVHGPLVAIIAERLVLPLKLGAIGSFFCIVAIAVPLTLTVATVFHRAFEAPFMRMRESGLPRGLGRLGTLRAPTVPRSGPQVEAAGR